MTATDLETPAKQRPPLPISELDFALTAQIVVAWAGERGEEPRLGWWRTDLASEFGGEDLFRRLLPHTWEWAALQGVREAARRKDAELRAKAHDPDQSGRGCRAKLGSPGVSQLGGGAWLLGVEVGAGWAAFEGRGAGVSRSGRSPAGCCAGTAGRHLSAPALSEGEVTKAPAEASAAALSEGEVAEAPAEATEVHTRLLKRAPEVEESRAPGSHAGNSRPVTVQGAFDEYWFGARSLSRVEALLANMRVRYDGYPAALAVLHRWPGMSPNTRRLICHWHLELADPLYRRFAGAFLPSRLSGPRPEVTRDLVVSWVSEAGPSRWTMGTRIQCASKLLSAACAAGLITSRRDPRPLVIPRIPDEALEYLVYLLRGLSFAGTLLDNPYAASVGLEGKPLEERLAALPALRFSRQGDLVDFGWRFADLATWADARLSTSGEPAMSREQPTSQGPLP